MKLKFSLLLSAGFNSILTGVLIKMCDSVGADFNTTNFFAADWFIAHSWSREQEETYIQWLSERLYKEKKQFKYISNGKIPHTKKNCRDVAAEFVYNYGWKLR